MEQQIKKGVKKATLNYLVKEPGEKGTKRKAIILLHGVGSNEKDLFTLANQFPGDFYIISARGPITFAEGSYAWYNVDFSSGSPTFKPAEEENSRKLISFFIQEIKGKYNLDEIYLGGFSQGAIMSYNIALTEPKLVRGIFSLSGRILKEIRSSVKADDDLKKLKVFVAHGVNDGTLPISYAKEAKIYLQTLNVKISYHEYNIGHQITEPVVKDLITWLATN